MNKSPLKILIVEDDAIFRKQLKRKVAEYGFTDEADNFNSARNLLESNDYDVAIIDLNLNDRPSGLKLLKMAKVKGIYSIILTDFHSPRYIQKAYEHGCNHYLTKDQFDVLIHVLLKERIESVIGQNEFDNFFKNNFITQDKNLKDEIRSLSLRISNPRPILILGETGVGKGELAQFIHRLKFQGNNNFVAVNVSSINENLVESELFGHKKGSFTGAHESKIGKLELANNGTLFLDEIASMPLSIQASLLKALEEKSFYPVGSTRPVKSNFQLISATCEDIYKKIKNESFRIDLFHRINGLIINIPPLRERKDDIPLLISHFINRSPRKIHINEDALKILTSYSWPGNIRELKATVDNLIDQSNGIISAKNLPDYIINNQNIYQNERKTNLLSLDNYNFIKLNGIKSFFDEVQVEAVKMALKEKNGNIRSAIKMIKLPSSTFYRYQKKVDSRLLIEEANENV